MACQHETPAMGGQLHEPNQPWGLPEGVVPPLPRTPSGPRRHRPPTRGWGSGAAGGGSRGRYPRLQGAPLLRYFPARPGVRPLPRFGPGLPVRPSLRFARHRVYLGLPGGRARVDEEGGIARPGFSCRRAWRPRVSPRQPPGTEAPDGRRDLTRGAVDGCRRRTAGSAWLRRPICSTLWPEVVSMFIL